MDFFKLAEAAARPAVFTPGSAVMWTDPYISRKLLAIHLDPSFDAASRSGNKIGLTVDWILSRAGTGPLDILDLGCGPGLYAERLAAAGHRVTGVDFSRNSIEYAGGETARNGSGITYLCGNYLDLEFDGRFDLVIMIYTDFCVLKPDDRDVLLSRIHRALKPGGRFIFDVVNGRNIEEKTGKPTWEVSTAGGFWREGPYLSLHRGWHYPEERVLLEQHVVLEPDGRTETYRFWSTWYEPETLVPVLERAGFGIIGHHDDVLPPENVWNGDNITFWVAVKG